MSRLKQKKVVPNEFQQGERTVGQIGPYRGKNCEIRQENAPQGGGSNRKAPREKARPGDSEKTCRGQACVQTRFEARGKTGRQSGSEARSQTHGKACGEDAPKTSGQTRCPPCGETFQTRQLQGGSEIRSQTFRKTRPRQASRPEILSETRFQTH